jgi:hypothetical protein
VGSKFEDRLPVVTRVRKCTGAGGDPYKHRRSGKFTKKVVDPQQQALLETVRKVTRGPRGYFLAKEGHPRHPSNTSPEKRGAVALSDRRHIDWDLYKTHSNTPMWVYRDFCYNRMKKDESQGNNVSVNVTLEL